MNGSGVEQSGLWRHCGPYSFAPEQQGIVTRDGPSLVRPPGPLGGAAMGPAPVAGERPHSPMTVMDATPCVEPPWPSVTLKVKLSGPQ
jgi:hypothetical protein